MTYQEERELPVWAKLPPSVWSMPPGLERPDGTMICRFTEAETIKDFGSDIQWGRFRFQRTTVLHTLENGQDCRACRYMVKTIQEHFLFGRPVYLDLLGLMTLKGDPDGSTWIVPPGEGR